MKKLFACTLLALTALLLFAQSPSVEAREHHHSTRVQLNLGNHYVQRDAYVVRRYVRPVAPVIIARPAPYLTPVYVAPVQQAYVEEVHVAPACRPLSFGGLSFSFNFFK